MSSRCGRILGLLILCGCLVLGQQREAANECTEYYRTRIAYLLGCCGDQPINYPGPGFASSLTSAELATRALQEIGSARQLRCYDASAAGAKTLALNEIGAHLMRALATPGNASPREAKAALLDADTAARELRTFVAAHPAGAARMWYWITMSFKRTGRLWDALAFLAGLPADCCGLQEVALVRGDLCFDLGMYEASAHYYSLWLANATSESLCGRKRSLNNTTELRRRGFKVVAAPPETQAACVVGSEWVPYNAWSEQ